MEYGIFDWPYVIDFIQINYRDFLQSPLQVIPNLSALYFMLPKTNSLLDIGLGYYYYPRNSLKFCKAVLITNKNLCYWSQKLCKINFIRVKLYIAHHNGANILASPTCRGWPWSNSMLSQSCGILLLSAGGPHDFREEKTETVMAWGYNLWPDVWPWCGYNLANRLEASICQELSLSYFEFEIQIGSSNLSGIWKENFRISKFRLFCLQLEMWEKKSKPE